MSPTLVCIFMLTLQLDSSNALNWCGIKCPPGTKHTVCERGPTCPTASDCTDVKGYTKNIRDKILDIHNEYRNKIALGQDDRMQDDLKKASNMMALSWNSGLEFVARCHVRGCEFKHDECRNTPVFDHVGQNIYYSQSSAVECNPEKVASDGLNSFYEEIKDMKDKSLFDVITKFHSTDPMTGHFTQVVWATTTHVGCAVANQGKKCFFFCNYGPTGNWNTQPVYEQGEPASKCPAGKKRNSKFIGLCGEIRYSVGFTITLGARLWFLLLFFWIWWLVYCL